MKNLFTINKCTHNKYRTRTVEGSVNYGVPKSSLSCLALSRGEFGCERILADCRDFICTTPTLKPEARFRGLPHGDSTFFSSFGISFGFEHSTSIFGSMQFSDLTSGCLPKMVSADIRRSFFCCSFNLPELIDFVSSIEWV